MCSRKWLILALVACALASACSDYNTNLSIQTSSSILTFVSPAAATVGGQGFTITANGSGFTTGALIMWNGTALTTTLVSSSQLTAPVPASNLATAGTVQVAVEIPGSAVSPTQNIYSTTTSAISNVVLFTINPVPGPEPTITSISAPSTSLASTPYCQPNGFALTVMGSNFVNGSVVNWNGSPRATTFGSSNQLTAAISAADAAFPGTARISVSNLSGSAPSNTVSFTMITPVTGLPLPVISSLSQTSVTAGSPTFDLVVAGNSFVPCSAVQWDGVTQPTTFVSSTQLTATIPAADFFTAGPGTTARNVNVTVFTLAPGGGSSGAILFTINP